MNDEGIATYIDDLILFAKTMDEAIDIIEKPLKILKVSGLSVNPAKTNLLQRKVEFLGHKVSEKGLEPPEKRIEVISNYPTPKNCKELRRFLGIINFQASFIEGCSKVARALNTLLKKDHPWTWGETETQSFKGLKERVSNPPCLVSPDHTKPYIITTDASESALGATLKQRHGETK